MSCHPGQLVRLKCSVPDLELHPGQLGVVCSRWCDPLTFYELEFNSPSNHVKVRIVLEEKQFEPLRRNARNAGTPAAAR